MARRPGNILRSSAEARVPNEPRTLLNLLKTISGIFGDLPNEAIDSLEPAIIFVEDGHPRCYSHPDTANLTRPFSHRELAEEVHKQLGSVVEAYLGRGAANATLFPGTRKLMQVEGMEAETLPERLTVLEKEFSGRATVTPGGIRHADQSADLVSIVLAARDYLEAASKKSLDYMATSEKLGSVVEGLLTASPELTS